MENESRIFAPYRLKNLTIKNRLVRAAMESAMGDPDGFVTKDQLQVYKVIAQGGAAVVPSSTGQFLVIFLAGINNGEHPGHGLFPKDGGRFLSLLLLRKPGKLFP